jgi:hypothetical protein
MPKETTAGSSEGGLVYLRYTYRYRNQFDEPNDDWLEAAKLPVTSCWELTRRQRMKP